MPHKKIVPEKNAGNPLNHQEEFFRRMVERAQDLIYRYEFIPKRGFTYVSPSATALTGYTPEEHYADADLGFKLVHPEDIHLLESATRGGTSNSQPVILRWIRKDGSIIWTEQRNAPIFDDQGNLIAIEGVARDITGRKPADDALRKSEERYRSLFNNVDEGVAINEIVLDENGNAVDYVILEVNPAFERQSPYTVKDAIGCRATDLYKMTSEFIRDWWGQHKRLTQPAQTEYYHEPSNRWFYIVTTLPENGRFASIFTNITERKRAEAALRASEEKYRTVADFTFDWEAWRAPDNSYNYVSPSCERITGYKAEEFLADSKLMIKITHPDDHGVIDSHLYAVGHQSQKNDYQLDFRIITRSGETRWIGHSCTAVYGENGQWLGRRESNRDITARKRDDITLKSRLWLIKFSDTHTVDELLENTLNEAEALTGSQIGFFHFLDANQNTLNLQVWSTNTQSNMCAVEGQDSHHPVDQAGVWVDCIRTGAPVVYNDYAALPASHRKGLPQGHAPVTRIVVVPVFFGDLIVAILGVGNKQTKYDEIDVKCVSQLAHMIWDVILRKRAEKEVIDAKEALQAANIELQAALIREQYLSHTDSLTGINNRRYLFELAEREFNIATRHQLPLTIMMFDIDHFKQINDTFGHDIGDLVLQCVVQAARAELRSSDVIGRYGGEEFVIILPLTTSRQAYPVAERIRAGVEVLRVPTHKEDAGVTLSIGIVELVLVSQETTSVDDFIRRADEAMYTAKQAGRNRVSIFVWE